jgi:hypothetical protein
MIVSSIIGSVIQKIKATGYSITKTKVQISPKIMTKNLIKTPTILIRVFIASVEKYSLKLYHLGYESDILLHGVKKFKIRVLIEKKFKRNKVRFFQRYTEPIRALP